MWKYPRPDTWQMFEQILVDWIQHALGDTGADRYGRTGQRQNGIDVLARNWRGVVGAATPEVWAIQAKDYADTALNVDNVERELIKALSHVPRPDVFVLATTAQRDTRLQDWALLASRDSAPTRVEVWFWDGFVERCLKESWFREKHLSAFWERRTPHQLPSPPPDFTGRDSEVKELVRRAEGGANLLILSGMGGIGKTALGLAIAERLVPRYPDGQIRIDLRGTDLVNRVTTIDAMSRVVGALEPRSLILTSSADIESAYQTALHDKRVLIFCDDAYDADQVQPLVPSGQSCVVITSRQKVVLPGGSADVVTTLSPTDSCRLLSRICSRLQRDGDVVAELCGYLPLALRLAATALEARPDLKAAQYIERLREERTRREFVDATVELSYQLLSPESRDAWTRLSVFRGAFDFQAATAVLSGSERAISDLLGNLLRHSMIDWDSATSRYVVHELLRLVADSRLGDTQREQVRLSHAEHFQRQLRTWKMEYRQGNESALNALQQVDRDLPHIRQAVEWVRAAVSRDDAYKKLLSLYLDAGVDIFPIRLAAQELVHWLEDAVAATRSLNQPTHTAAHLGNLGAALENVGDYQGAIRVQEEVLKIANQSKDPRGTANALGNLATLYLNTREFAKSIDFARQSVRVEQRRGNRKGLAADLNTLGQAYLHTGEHDKALVMFAQSLQLKREIGDRLGEATTWAGIGQTYAAQGKHGESAVHFSDAVSIFKQLGYKEGEESARTGLCLSILKAGAFGGLTPDQLSELSQNPPKNDRGLVERSVRYLGIQAARAKSDGKHVEYAARIGDIATLQSALGQDEVALALHDQSIELGRTSGTPKLEANSHFNKAVALARLGRIDEAITTMEAARDIYARLGLSDVADAEAQLTAMKGSIGTDAERSTSKRKRTVAKKVGRNERCPCGSGKKYKQCCLGTR